MVEESAAGITPSQVDRNFRAFQEKLPEIAAVYAGKLAVLHDGEIVDFFDTYADAVRFGIEKFQDIGNFSVQAITNRPASLGFHSYAANYVSERRSRSNA